MTEKGEGLKADVIAKCGNKGRKRAWLLWTEACVSTIGGGFLSQRHSGLPLG